MADPFYQSAEWKALRRACLARDGYRCTVPGCRSKYRLTADHIVRRSDGGDDALGNLRTLCGPHHSEVTRSGNTALPSARGCDINGNPLDPGHLWSKGTSKA